MTGITERLKAALSDRYRIERELGEGGMWRRLHFSLSARGSA